MPDSKRSKTAKQSAVRQEYRGRSHTDKQSAASDEELTLGCWIPSMSDEPFPVDVGKGKMVGHLKGKIKKALEPKLNHLTPCDLDIWKLSPPIHSSELDVKLRDAQSPQDIPGCAQLHSLDPLSKHFSSPPDEHVHIIVQLPPPLTPRTPIKKAFDTGSLLRSPSDPDVGTKVEAHFQSVKFRVAVRAFLVRNDLFEWWNPTCDVSVEKDEDRSVRNHFAKLRIPSVLGKPCLSLHDLGGSVVEPTIIHSVFQRQQPNIFLINTSGSGKTRILFEGLSRFWGLYFTCSKTQVLGSRDTSSVLYELPRASNFKPTLPSASESDLRQALEHNRRIARRRFRQVLTARLLVLRLFLEEARKISPEGSLDQYRAHWLALQLRPSDVVANDIFLSLTTILSAASDEYLGLDAPGAAVSLGTNIVRDFISVPLYFVLDEAQLPAQMYKEAYRSDSDISKQRPVLREILRALDIQNGTTIVSGTGLSEKEFRDTLGSEVAKGDIRQWITYTETGAFDSPQAQSSYISRYLPPHLIQSVSGLLLLRRCWLWLRGRHRFTAAYLEILISNSFFSPHKVLDEYILHFTSQDPYDSPNFAGSEYQPSKKLIANIQTLSFIDLEKITKDPTIAHRLGDIICSWVLRHKYVVLNDDEKRWVELGLARFCHSTDTSKEQTMVDEPLIIHATTHYLAKHTSMGLFDHVLNRLAHDAGIGSKFEDFLAVYLAHPIGSGVRLSDIFDFGENVPSWALSEGVELLALSSDGDHHAVSHPMGPSSSLSCDPKTAEETVDWFRKPSTLMCFPDNLLGPDLVFFIRLPDGRVLCVIVQAKFRSQGSLSEKEQDNATSTLTPSNFYTKKTDRPSLRQEVIEAVGKLGRINHDERWFPDGLPFLRVLATFPTKPHKPKSPVVNLNMDRCKEKMDRGNFLCNLIQRLVPKRRNDEMEGANDNEVEVKRKKK